MTGPHAAELWQVDQQLDALNRRRNSLLQALRDQQVASESAPAATPLAAPRPTQGPTSTSPPGPLAGQGAVRPQSAPTGPDIYLLPRSGSSKSEPPPFAPPGTEPAPKKPSLTGQRLLLATGVVLVFVAAIIFLAVAWGRIGVVGQVAVMAMLTALAAGGAFAASKRGLSASAEALGVLAGGLLLLDIIAAPSLGLAGLDQVSGGTYLAVAGLATGLLLGGLHLLDIKVRAFAFLAFAALSLGVVGLLLQTETSLGAAAFSLTAAVGFGAMAVWLPRSAGHLQKAAGGPGVTWQFLATLFALMAALQFPGFNQGVPAEAFVGMGLLALIAVGGGLLVNRVVAARTKTSTDPNTSVARQWLNNFSRGRWRALSGVAIFSTMAAIGAVFSLGAQLGQVVTVILATLLVVPQGVLSRAPIKPGRAWVRATTLLSQLALLLGADSQQAFGGIVVTLALSALAVGVVWAPSRVLLLPLSVALGAGGAAMLLELYGRLPVVLALAGIAVAAIAAAGWRRGHLEEIGLGGTGGILFLICAFVAGGPWDGPGSPGLTASVLTLLGVVALGYAWLPGRRLVTIVSVAALTGALWVMLVDLEVTQIEAYSLPLALMVLAADLWLQLGRHAGWSFVGRGLAIGVLPSAVVTLFGDGLIRPILTTVACLILVAFAISARWWLLAGVACAAQIIVIFGAGHLQGLRGALVLTFVVTVALYAWALPAQRGKLVPVAAGAISLGLGLLVDLAGWIPLVLVLTAAGAFWVILAGVRRARTEEAGLAVVGGLTLSGAFTIAFVSSSAVTMPVVVLCVVGAVSVLYAALPQRRLAVILAVIAFTVALGLVLQDRDIGLIEAYSLPFALMVLGAGLWLRSKAAPSWTFVGPAVVLGLVPSALVSLSEGGVLRPLLTIVAGAIVLAIGVALRWQALVITGALVTLMVGVSQVVPYAVYLPRWLTIALVGGSLLALGIRYESATRGAKQAIGWVGSLR
ncbi:hypothetical protein K0651_04290 [Ornithinimicrobium sp. Arc0846-15]|nr:hypothetical protein [Ornithinimicrobium laminariae]